MSRNNLDCETEDGGYVYVGQEDRAWFFKFFAVDHEDDDEPYKEPLWFWEI